VDLSLATHCLGELSSINWSRGVNDQAESDTWWGQRGYEFLHWLKSLAALGQRPPAPRVLAALRAAPPAAAQDHDRGDAGAVGGGPMPEDVHADARPCLKGAARRYAMAFGHP
jgi:hypothetical protein